VPKPTPDNKSTPRPRIIWHTGGGRRPARCSGRSSGAKHARASTPTGSVICWQGHSWCAPSCQPGRSTQISHAWPSRPRWRPQRC